MGIDFCHNWHNTLVFPAYTPGYQVLQIQVHQRFLFPLMSDRLERFHDAGLGNQLAAVCHLHHQVYCIFFHWIRIDASIPLILQPFIFGVLATLCFIQTLYYDPGTRHPVRIAIVASLICLSFAIIGLVLGLLLLKDPTILGICSTVILLIGFLPQFHEIYRLKRVMGISLVFLAIDILGGVFSLISLAFRTNGIDWTAASFYLGVVVCDIIIVILYYSLPWLVKVQT